MIRSAAAKLVVLPGGKSFFAFLVATGTVISGAASSDNTAVLQTAVGATITGAFTLGAAYVMTRRHEGPKRSPTTRVRTRSLNKLQEQLRSQEERLEALEDEREEL